MFVFHDYFVNSIHYKNKIEIKIVLYTDLRIFFLYFEIFFFFFFLFFFLVWLISFILITINRK